MRQPWAAQPEEAITDVVILFAALSACTLLGYGVMLLLRRFYGTHQEKPASAT